MFTQHTGATQLTQRSNSEEVMKATTADNSNQNKNKNSKKSASRLQSSTRSHVKYPAKNSIIKARISQTGPSIRESNSQVFKRFQRLHGTS